MNDSGAPRVATVTVTLPKGLSKSFNVSQDRSSLKAITEVSTPEQFVAFIENASNVDLYTDGLVTKLTKDIDLKRHLAYTCGGLHRYSGRRWPQDP